MDSKRLGLASGIGLVIANMIGAGVFLSGGFMAQTLTAGQIMASWVVGLLVALMGAYAYSAIATHNPRSGGEYRYLHDHLHPFLGSLSGWASLLVGFSATIAIDAYAAGAFLKRVIPEINPQFVGLALLLAITAMHTFNFDFSRRSQNALVVVKFGFVLVFVALGLILGQWAWPAWTPPNPSTDFPWESFASNQYWVAFAFSGWNASIYIAQEFKEPARNVPRAMLFGCTIVGLVYLLINWIVVANLDPATAFGVVKYDDEKVTLAHLVMESLVGPDASKLVSLAAALVFTSALSAMVMLGPRVYAAMAEDGALPRFMAFKDDHPPKASFALQLAIAVVLLFSQSILEIITSASVVLMIFSGLTCLTVAIGRIPASPLARICGALYVLAVGLFLHFGQWSTATFYTVGAILLLTTVGFFLTRPQK
jgi:APA family basic amino acid/polyamine antiporter